MPYRVFRGSGVCFIIEHVTDIGSQLEVAQDPAGLSVVVLRLVAIHRCFHSWGMPKNGDMHSVKSFECATPTVKTLT